MTKADKALASMLAAATLVVGVAPAALADDQTPAPNPDSGTTAPITTDRLDKTIENAHAVDLTRDWTKTTKDAFDTALTNANNVKSNSTATQTDIDKATVALETAIGNLTTTEREALKAAKADAAKYRESDYTADSYKPLKDLLAQSDPENTKAGDSDAQTRANAITAAEGDLVAQSYADLNEAIAKADAENARNLTYPKQADREFYAALKDSKDALGEPADASNATVKARSAAQTALTVAYNAVRGQSAEQRNFGDALAKAKAKDLSKYDDADGLKAAIEQADGLDVDTADAAAFKAATKALEDGIPQLTVNGWTVGGAALTRDVDGSFSADLGEADRLPELKATGSDGTTVTLKDAKGGFTQGGDKLGKGTVRHTLTGTTEKGRAITVTVDVKAGSETTASMDGGDPVSFKQVDGVWTAAISGDNKLGSAAKADGSVADVTAWAHEVAMSDGTKLERTLGEVAKTTADGKTTWVRAITYTGITSAGARVAVTVNASHTYDSTSELKVTATDAQSATPRDVLNVKGDVADLKDSYTSDTQDHDRIGDAYKASLTGSADAVSKDPGVSVTYGIGANGARVFHIKYRTLALKGTVLAATDKTVDVTVPFAAPKREASNPDARLDGFDIKGDATLDPAFDPDVLDYTIHLKTDQHVSVAPRTRAGTKAVAGDVSQTAFTTVQSWTVTADSGQSRVYTVTAVRDHTEQTADEKFTPNDPVGTVSKDPNPSETNTKLRSWGYTLDGKYTAVDSDTFQIPEGGTLAYESYEGQAVNATGVRSHGMTWDYDVSVLAADHETYGSTTLHVTYITAETNAAYLTGIKVDGKAINGFDPSKTEYSVQVADPTQYVVTPQFDKMTGMSVSTHKTDSEAVVTATSADGLEKAVYTVHVSKAPLLASTGVRAGIAAAVVVVLAAIAAALGLASRRKGKTEQEDEPAETDGEPKTE